MSRVDVNAVLYICDGRACERPTCCAHNGTGECRHTSKWVNALHKDADPKGFIAVPSRVPGKVDLWEPDDD